MVGINSKSVLIGNPVKERRPDEFVIRFEFIQADIFPSFLAELYGNRHLDPADHDEVTHGNLRITGTRNPCRVGIVGTKAELMVVITKLEGLFETPQDFADVKKRVDDAIKGQDREERIKRLADRAGSDDVKRRRNNIAGGARRGHSPNTVGIGVFTGSGETSLKDTVSWERDIVAGSWEIDNANSGNGRGR